MAPTYYIAMNYPEIDFSKIGYGTITSLVNDTLQTDGRSPFG